MAGTALEQVAALRTVVEQAKGVPMSASAMVNRGEVLGQLDRLRESLTAELVEARTVVGDSDARIVEAEERAGRIVAEAEQRARSLVEQDAVARLAAEEAARLLEEARDESDALRREADRFVDGRIAELEAGLARTHTSLTTTMDQVRTMRARLAERSHLDDPEPFD